MSKGDHEFQPISQTNLTGVQAIRLVRPEGQQQTRAQSIASELLAGGLQEVAGGARNDVAGNRAFDIDAHSWTLRAPLADRG